MRVRYDFGHATLEAHSHCVEMIQGQRFGFGSLRRTRQTTRGDRSFDTSPEFGGKAAALPNTDADVNDLVLFASARQGNIELRSVPTVGGDDDRAVDRQLLHTVHRPHDKGGWKLIEA